MHFWSVWHEGRDFDHYRDVSPRFCCEFGFQSYPSMEVIRRFAEPEDCNIASPVLESHQKNAGGNARIAETMFRYFRWPERFRGFRLAVSQIQQGAGDQDRRDALAQPQAALHGHALLAAERHLAGAAPGPRSTTAAGGSCCTTWPGRFYAPVTVVAVPQDGAIRLVGCERPARGASRSTVTAWATRDGRHGARGRHGQGACRR